MPALEAFAATCSASSSSAALLQRLQSDFFFTLSTLRMLHEWVRDNQKCCSCPSLQSECAAWFSGYVHGSISATVVLQHSFSGRNDVACRYGGSSLSWKGVVRAKLALHLRIFAKRKLRCLLISVWKEQTWLGFTTLESPSLWSQLVGYHSQAAKPHSTVRKVASSCDTIIGWTSSNATANLPGSQRTTLPENITLSFLYCWECPRLRRNTTLTGVSGERCSSERNIVPAAEMSTVLSKNIRSSYLAGLTVTMAVWSIWRRLYILDISCTYPKYLRASWWTSILPSLLGHDATSNWSWTGFTFWNNFQGPLWRSPHSVLAEIFPTRTSLFTYTDVILRLLVYESGGNFPSQIKIHYSLHIFLCFLDRGNALVFNHAGRSTVISSQRMFQIAIELPK